MALKYKPTIDDYVEAIIARDGGMPYPEVLKTFELTPNKFAWAISMGLETYIAITLGKGRKILEEIASDPERRRELFNMGEEFVRRQYDRIQGKIPGETQKIFYRGTLFHQENINALVYYSLICNLPRLASDKRTEIICEIKNLPFDLAKYFAKLKLNGLMVCSLLGRGKQGSPLAILEIFDKAYQKKTGDKSLFDLSQTEHLHKWGDMFRAPNSYWKDKNNVEEAVYHVLTENHPNLVSCDRSNVVIAINRLPNNLLEHFQGFGLGGLMASAPTKGKKGSPLAILEIFDKVYQKKTGDKSLFDLSQTEHLHKWGDKFMAPLFYWQDQKNVEDAVYHILTENNPQFTSHDRIEVIEGIKKLPFNLKAYLSDIGFDSLMVCAPGVKGSPLAILEIFDKVYQKKTGDKSLFDLSQTEHLHRWGGTFRAPNSYWKDITNVEEAVYHVLTENNPLLVSHDRIEIIRGIKELPLHSVDYFCNLKLGGLVSKSNEGMKTSFLRILEIFDKVYQKKTGDKSLFDLSQTEHLHRWGGTFRAPNSYWKDITNVEEAVYHVLTENHSELISGDRNEVIGGIKNLPSSLARFFHNIGLSGLMINAFDRGKRDSPLAILEIFDKVYQEKTGDKSLFDSTQEIYLEVDAKNRVVRG